MRFPSLKLTCISLTAILFIASCSNKTEQFQTDQLTDYIQTIPGKYITYRVDSLLFPNFGRGQEIRKSQQKHVIDAMITDNLGRPSYRIFRFTRDSVDAQSWTAAQPWVPSGSYQVTILGDQVEVIEDNRRFIKLHMPLRMDRAWMGNKYLPDNTYSPLYSFNNDDFMEDWEYIITGIHESAVINGTVIDSVLTVSQVDNENLVDTFNVMPVNKVDLPLNMTTAWIRGTATDTVNVSAPAPTLSNFQLRIYNYSNFAVGFNGTYIPPTLSRSYEYLNGLWQYKDGKDTLFADLPYGSKDYSIEKYAKNIGLVYREYVLWEYQPNPGNSNGVGPYKTGFGVKMWMIEHN